MSLRREKYNLEEFQTKYDHAKFYVIKSYSEDDVHKCIKYDVWSSTPNGNKKLDAAYRESEGKTNIFLFFSVGLKQGLEMLEIFKSYSAKTSLLDDLGFYGNREKMLKAKRISKAAFQTEKNSKSGERMIGE
ncbi:hypothetical protein L1887_28864 [Cichorium endivia]|nr:hypothetical protein L1887_28864 [Cichorium endivia]